MPKVAISDKWDMEKEHQKSPVIIFQEPLIKMDEDAFVWDHGRIDLNIRKELWWCSILHMLAQLFN